MSDGIMQTPREQHDKWLQEWERHRPTRRGWHYCRREHNKRSDGFPALAFGIRVGYWPCLYGWFVSVAWGAASHEWWHGLPATPEQPSGFGRKR